MSLHISRRVGITAVAAMVAATLGGAGIGYAASSATAEPAIKTSTPRSEKDVTNLDVLRQQLRNYYGDPLGSGTFGADSNYAREARSVAASGERYLSRHHPPSNHPAAALNRTEGPQSNHPAAALNRTEGPQSNHPAGALDRTNDRAGKTRAIVLDVDDTTLATWNYEVFSNWAYNPATNATFVTEQRFPAVPGMVRTARAAEREGYAIFFLTGRPAAQEAATLGNLTADGVGVDAGYPKPTTLRDGEDGLFTKPAVADYPDYLKAACAGDPNGSCTTVHYKSATRAHIESLGYDIVANFGDQFSDLKGGHADRTFKLPNPNYFLP